MEKTTTKYYCDICKLEINKDNKNVNVPLDSLTYKFGSGAYMMFEHICPECAGKIRNFIDELTKIKL